MKVFEFKHTGDKFSVISKEDCVQFITLTHTDATLVNIPTPQAVRLAYAILESVGAR